jgi:hypothetical protein
MNNSKQLVRDLATGEVTPLVSDLGRLALRRTSDCPSDQNVLYEAGFLRDFAGLLKSRNAHLYLAVLPTWGDGNKNFCEALSTRTESKQMPWICARMALGTTIPR